jgi:hypothetical protein
MLELHFLDLRINDQILVAERDVPEQASLILQGSFSRICAVWHSASSEVIVYPLACVQIERKIRGCSPGSPVKWTCFSRVGPVGCPPGFSEAVSAGADAETVHSLTGIGVSFLIHRSKPALATKLACSNRLLLSKQDRFLRMILQC